MDRIVKTSYPLSYGQKAMWFIYQMDINSVVYNMFITVKINSYLNITAVNRVWQKIIEHHPILRTTYTSHEGKPVQQINQQYKFNLEVIDASNWSEDYLKEKIFAITDRPFNLEKDSVLRVNLFTRSAKEHILLLTMHHIAGDMWSFDLLLSEFQALYANEIEQVSQEQTESAADYLTKNKSYLEFVYWQSEMLSGSRGEKLWQYWQQQLAGELPILNLLADKPRPPVKTYQEAAHISKLDEQLIQKLKHLVLASGTSLYQILLAAFYVQLYRYTNQTDILIASPMRGRWSGDFKEIVGYFVNLIVLRTAVQENATFTEFLAQVSNTVKAAQNHQDYPFSLLAEQLQPQRDPTHSPLCQVSFASQRQRWWESTEKLLHSGEQVLEMEPYLLGHQRGADFDLNLMVMEAQGMLQLCWQYNTDLFEATTITRMAVHFVTLLEGIVANPQQRISQLPLLSPTEHHQLLIEWNTTQTDYPADQCIHHLFAAQVEQFPDVVAVVFGEQKLTYQELNAQANQLAHYLQKLGVKPGVLVGICVERSVSMVVGLLAILKAGAAYVPLDTEYPKERLAFIIEDTQISVLLTTQKLTDAIPKHQARVVGFDTDAAAIALFSKQNPIAAVTSDNLAYVIYTSGSTGQPKGVAVEHRAVNRLVLNTNYINIEPKDVIAQASNYAFDAATFEIWGALLHGARLVGVSKELALSPKNFAAFMRSQGISVLFLTTALFNQIAQEVPSAFNSLRHLLFGGEAVDPKWVKEVLKNGAPQRLLHVYGPTENTTFTSWYLVQDVPEGATTIPIGRPIANTQIYLLDSQLQSVGVGVPGELYIGGDGLAREYLNRPELTQEKFILNPFSCQPGDRLYKTGDKARYLSDGNIEFLGRIDYQVKIRGFRIELGEIETVLNQHPLLQESVVVVREDISGDTCTERLVPSISTSLDGAEAEVSRSKRLVAYLVPTIHRQTSPQQVTQWQSEYISDWQTLYEQLYSQNQASTDDLTFNITGWNSSYTKQPIPDWEMQEWVENTVSRILSVLPQRVLEIGCGTGLLLSRVAKHCQQYWGTDYSIAAIQHVEQLCGAVEGLEHVQLRHQLADNFADIPKGEFDTIILNSVVQYFPSVEYLLQVLEGAMVAIAQQGTLFVGDVRSLPLLEPYHTAVQLSQAPEERTIEQWQRMVHQSVTAEEELVIDPSFFIALQTRFPQITWVEIQPKRGYSQNELTQFRYDVTLHVGTDVQARIVPWLNWQLDKLSLTQIQNQLQKEQPELLGIRGVPNQRVQQALQTWQWLEHPPSVETVGQLRELLAQQPTVGINPEEFWVLGQHLGYTVHLSWWGSSQDGCYDVVFCHNSLTPRQGAMPELGNSWRGYANAYAFWDTSTVTTKPWTDYTNNPLHGKLVQKLVPQVRSFIQEKLPDYMVPQAFVLLNALPLTPNGKVDRRALPTPDTATRNLATGFVSPRTPTEAQIVQIWSEVLGVEQISIKDNFFELGGHSLLATQVISRINSAFGLDLSVQMMFESPTVAGIATYIEVVGLVTQDLSIKKMSSKVVKL
jgi:amino acid adenylation domain-containing protein